MAQPGITRAICAGAFALIATPAVAHHPGGASNTGGAGPIVTISASTLEVGHGAVAFLTEYLKFGGLGDSDLIAAAGKHIHAHSIDTIRSTSLSAAYGVTDDFTVSVRIPYVQRTDIREGHHAHGPGGVVSNTNANIGNETDGTGTVTVTGTDSTWTSSGNLLVGNHGTGTLLPRRTDRSIVQASIARLSPTACRRWASSCSSCGSPVRASNAASAASTASRWRSLAEASIDRRSQASGPTLGRPVSWR